MDLFNLVARLTLDKSEYEQGLSDTQKEADGFGGKIQSAVGGLAKGVAAVGAAGAAAAVAVGGIAKSAVQGFADSQQLFGGIETLFGDSAQKVIAKANDAFKTAGLSANEYMDTTIQSAAAMISSLGGDQAKAAELMDLSITDMSDNVNKMGTSMEGVQDAYRGFSRGNFTMLDNLALGYSGTKEGMQELLTKAEELERQQGRSTKYSIDNYADIVQAIHVVQTEMGITGTTAAEADKTISGSIGSVKTAWQNLINGIADPNADIGQLINNVVDSGKTALKNILPAFKQALKGISQAIKEIVPIITQELPGIVDDVAPSLIEAAASLIAALITALPNLISAIVKMIPQIMKTIGTAVKNAWPAIQQAIMDGLGTTGGKIVAGVMAAWTAIKGLGIISGITNAIGIIGPLITGLASPIGLIVAAVAAAAVAIVMNWDKIKAAWVKAKEFFGNVWKGIQGAFQSVGTWISQKFKAAWDGVKNAWKGAVSWFSDIGKKILGVFTNLPGQMLQAGHNLMEGLKNGIIEGANGVIDKAKSVASNVLGAVKGFFGIKSPSTVFHGIGGYLMEGLANGITDSMGMVEDAMGSLGDLLYAEAPTEDLATDTSTTTSMFGDSSVTVPRQSAPSQQTVILQLDRMQLGRVVYQLNNAETQRVGVQLAGGFA